MIFSMREYRKMINNLNINIIYSGPMWEDGIKGIAEMLKSHLSHEELPGSAAKHIFSVFIEQITNVLMYSVEREQFNHPDHEPVEISSGMVVLGQKDKTYFVQTGNTIKSEGIELIKGRIDHLNSLDKKELRQYHKECLHSENNNPESKGAGLGLIEIARRATAPIVYTFESINENLTYFTMYVEIGEQNKGE